MRLTCPNCGAQYEVPDEVIPPEGRDVQCSNCSHTWFQAHPAHPEGLLEDEAELLEEEEELRAAVTGEDWTPPPEPEAPTPPRTPEWDAPEEETAAAEEIAEDAPEAWDEEEDDEEIVEAAAPPPAAPARAAIDTSVADILREEAERETRLRARESGSLESQPELGLESYDRDDTDLRARQAQDRMARLQGGTAEPEPSEDAATDPATGSRRDLLPDIEEINSTLRAGGTGARPAAAEESAETRGDARGGSTMVRGFAVALLIGAALLLVYVNAPRIARAVPQADPMLSAYVAMVDQARYWVDSTLGGTRPE
ncbi:zinc-ribbon domain-containing protein [Pseudodonghicola flavimaris]|uniref:Zinc-ribbon domain-containing protein n=1 Tax=Pseudodonghicola flavimaris TaxID=3050036 RepID=A0ABT7EX88_9RHOB|nr:zinc-ribbon domain-containing protein [Pseudodonghicola flavimaris]MDK3016952.1 zinc-ribbon domain-containing protein [Pseudodonghicola flavimaris]